MVLCHTASGACNGHPHCVTAMLRFTSHLQLAQAQGHTQLNTHTHTITHVCAHIHTHVHTTCRRWEGRPRTPPFKWGDQGEILPPHDQWLRDMDLKAEGLGALIEPDLLTGLCVSVCRRACVSVCVSPRSMSL